MAVARCFLCEENPVVGRRYGQASLEEGMNCPICFRPACRYHLATVRWRWRATGKVEVDLICKECRRTYAQRDWDAVNRDWIT